MSESRVRKYYLGREGVNEILKIISKETFIDSSIINLGQKYNDLESRDNISTIINEAFEEYNCVFLPNGVYTITNPIEITGNFKKFYCLGEIKSSAAAAIEISGSYNDIYIKSIISNVQTEDDFGCAILLNNNEEEEKYVYYNNIIVDKIVGFESCFCFNPTAEKSGIAYTNITFKEINGKYGIYFPGDNGFVNENIFNGGVINCKYSIYTLKNNIKDPYNGNKFNHIALEGGPNRMYLNYFRYNHFNDCRFSTEENGWWRNNLEDETETGTFIEFGEGAWGNSFNFVGYVYSNFLKATNSGESGTLPNYFYGFLARKLNEDDRIIILGKKGYFIKEGLMIIKDEDRLDGDYTMLAPSQDKTEIDLFNQEYAIEGYSYKIQNIPSGEFIFRPPQGYFYSRALYFYINVDNIEEGGNLLIKLQLDSGDYTLYNLRQAGLYRITFNCAGGYYTEKLI